ncbi:MAG: nucleotidyltransferase domain-containing protein [Candidatus Methanoperedenaceae archaeon]|nr:MAG: nucleotidyltransferase domain-containing protein [Candidatus Methanoperedenaceae archaeon]
MQTEELIIKLKREFEFIKDDVEGILLYGSCAMNTANERSDIDICLIKPRTKGILNRIFQKVGGRYDIKIFEDLPLYVQIEVIRNYRVIYGDEPSISYYFYHFRKNWEDMSYRITGNRFKTVTEMTTTRRKWLETRGQVSYKS